MTFRSIGVLGLARSGRAAVELALAKGIGVYAADAADNADLRAGTDDLGRRGADVELGRIDVEKLAKVDAMVVSPGIPPRTPPLDDPRLAKVQRDPGRANRPRIPALGTRLDIGRFLPHCPPVHRTVTAVARQQQSQTRDGSA